YIFEVRASNNGIDWFPSGNKLKLRILPAPWLSWWALTMYIALGVCIILAIRQSELKKNRLRNRLELEQLEKTKWKEIHDLKLKYFTDVSHEFRTPLTLITGPVEDLMNHRDSSDYVQQSLKTVYYNSKRLLLLIDQVLDVNKIDAGRLTLKKTSVSIDDLMTNIVSNFEPIAQRLGILLTHTPQKNSNLFMVDVDKFEKIFYNLLSNAF